MATVTKYVATYTGAVAFSNPGAQTNPLLTWVTRSGKIMPALSTMQPATATGYQVPAGFKTGDVAYMQRVQVTASGVKATGSVFSAVIPAQPNPIKPTPVDPPIVKAEDYVQKIVHPLESS